MQHDDFPYGFELRTDVAQITPPAKRLLDVGCSNGGFGYELRRTHDDIDELWGIEADPGAAAHAAAHFDHVITGLYPHDLPRGERFDVVSFNDVLEHLEDPWSALAYTRDEVLEPGGYVVASIPNIRFLPVLAELAFHGRWTYTDTGTLDRTHLRFFTRQTIAEMFEQAGFCVEHLEGVWDYAARGGRRRRPLKLLPADLRWMWYDVKARAA